MTGMRILIADDEAHLTRIVAHNLTKAGADIAVACNGAELVEQARAHRPDLIVTDYQMPILDGYGACVQLKKDPATADIPVVMLTARGHRLSPEEMALTNIKLVLPKPFSVKQLISEIDRITAMNGPATADNARAA